MTEDPGRSGDRPSQADLLDALVRDAYHASLAMHAALASAHDTRTCDHIRNAIASVQDVIEAARDFAIDVSERTDEE